MASFRYFTGPMDCGKSTLALQIDHTHTAGGRRGRLFTSRDRAGEAIISSRLGLRRPAVEVHPGFGFWGYVVEQLSAGGFYMRTTLDPTLQTAARQALMQGLENYDRRHGWRGGWGSTDFAVGWQAVALKEQAPPERRSW